MQLELNTHLGQIRHATGDYRRAITTVDCNSLRSVAGGTALEPLLGLTAVFDTPGLCGAPAP